MRLHLRLVLRLVRGLRVAPRQEHLPAHVPHQIGVHARLRPQREARARRRLEQLRAAQLALAQEVVAGHVVFRPHLQAQPARRARRRQRRHLHGVLPRWQQHLERRPLPARPPRAGDARRLPHLVAAPERLDEHHDRSALLPRGGTVRQQPREVAQPHGAAAVRRLREHQIARHELRVLELRVLPLELARRCQRRARQRRRRQCEELVRLQLQLPAEGLLAILRSARRHARVPHLDERARQRRAQRHNEREHLARVLPRHGVLLLVVRDAACLRNVRAVERDRGPRHAVAGGRRGVVCRVRVREVGRALDAQLQVRELRAAQPRDAPARYHVLSLPRVSRLR